MGNYTSSSDDLMMCAFLICAFLYSGVSYGGGEIRETKETHGD